MGGKDPLATLHKWLSTLALLQGNKHECILILYDQLLMPTTTEYLPLLHFLHVDLVDKFTVGFEQKQQLKMQFVVTFHRVQFLEINNTTLNLGVIFHIWWDNSSN